MLRKCGNYIQKSISGIASGLIHFQHTTPVRDVVLHYAPGRDDKVRTRDHLRENTGHLLDVTKHGTSREFRMRLLNASLRSIW
jgi:hypothetical protein